MALLTKESIERLSPVFKGPIGGRLAHFLLHVTGIDQVAERYDRFEDLSGPAFVKAYFDDLDLHYEAEGLDHLRALTDGPFITVSNHPYGGLDGMILIDLFGRLRPDYKVMANQILSMVKTLDDSFISVVPKTKDSSAETHESLRGVKQAMEHVRAGHPLGLFPAGAVSDFSLRDRCVRDREWQQPAIRFIRKMNVPVVPVRFFDGNSSWFYFLGLLNWKLRTSRLPREVLNKKGKTIRLGIGEIISVEAQMRVSEADYASMLRASVYDIVESDRSE